MTLRTWPEAIRPASPVRPLPALLATTVSSRAPCEVSASINSSGAPTAPKPAHSTTAPSLMSETASMSRSTILLIIALEGDSVAAFELQYLARLGRAGALEREIFEYAAGPADLIGVRFGELPLADVDRILEPDANIAAHDRGHRHERQLMPAGGEHGPSVLLAEQLVGDPFHMPEVLRFRT